MQRISLIDPSLPSLFEQLSLEQVRAITLAVCKLAISLNKIDHPVVSEAMLNLEARHYDNTVLKEKLETLVNALDEKQWSIQELLDKHKASEKDYLLAFKQARACNALLSALQTKPLDASTDAIYEAYHAGVDLKSILQLISAS